MVFQNSEIDINQIPSANDVALHPVSANYYKVQRYAQYILWAITALVISILTYLIIELQDPFVFVPVIGIFIIGFILNYLLTYLSFQNKAYAVRMHDIIYQTGWLIKTTHFCPIQKIQHCSIHSGVFERKFGLAKIQLFTSGENDSDITIPGLTADEAMKIKTLVLAQKGGNGQ